MREGGGDRPRLFKERRLMESCVRTQHGDPPGQSNFTHDVIGSKVPPQTPGLVYGFTLDLRSLVTMQEQVSFGRGTEFYIILRDAPTDVRRDVLCVKRKLALHPPAPVL
ncbi:hypothetical protein NDU88_000204 [Pleurodeles waltl]|uniref:Uncharacterized protein n=1 Tax=Pleurodeles waltl TaxID=8319 RepID=A0AAV7L7V4_PLEWA|nr:hypothetical protein NDU88_000204 [Pleurodeles waltl]